MSKYRTLMDDSATALNVLLSPLSTLMAHAGITDQGGAPVDVESLSRTIMLNIAPPPDSARRRLKEDRDKANLAVWSTIDAAGHAIIYMHPDVVLKAAAGDGGEVIRLTGGLLHAIASSYTEPETGIRSNGTRYTKVYTAEWLALAERLGLTDLKQSKTTPDLTKTAKLQQAVAKACCVVAPSIGAKPETPRIRFAAQPFITRADGTVVPLTTKRGDEEMDVRFSVGEKLIEKLHAMGAQAFQFRLLVLPPGMDDKDTENWLAYSPEEANSQRDQLVKKLKEQYETEQQEVQPVSEQPVAQETEQIAQEAQAS